MIRILTDSTADLLPHQASALGVRVVPLTIHFGDTHFLDGVELTSEQFYGMLAGCEKLPTTSQPAPGEFLREFLDAREAGDDVICILLSSALSGTFQSAQIAAAEADYDRIFLVDSRSVTLGLQLLVRRAVHLAASGLSAPEITEHLEQAKQHLRLYAVVDTLKYLHRGGRLSAAAALAGGLLGVKPIVTLTPEGSIQLAGKARGLPGAYVALFKKIDEAGGIADRGSVLVGSTGSTDTTGPIVHYLTQNLSLSEPEVYSIGAVVGTHAGPGACGIAFFAVNAFDSAD